MHDLGIFGPFIDILDIGIWVLPVVLCKTLLQHPVASKGTGALGSDTEGTSISSPCPQYHAHNVP